MLSALAAAVLLSGCAFEPYRSGASSFTRPILNAGDTALTESGSGHSVKNAGDTPLEMIALILYK